jgi:hypothetical protein
VTAAALPARHPQDWYVEQSWTVRALMQMVKFNPEYTVWDPCCGLGTIPMAFAEAGFTVVGSDLVDRWSAQTLGMPHLFMGEHDFLGSQRHMMESWPLLDIVFNPPYSVEADIAERCIRKALNVVHGKVCALLPIRWRASEKRFAFFREYPPLEILEFCDRPSMPPGDQLHQRDPKTGALSAWRRGKTDYAWYHWDKHFPRPATVSRIIPPRSAEQKRIDRADDLRRVGALPPLEMELAA